MSFKHISRLYGNNLHIIPFQELLDGFWSASQQSKGLVVHRNNKFHRRQQLVTSERLMMKYMVQSISSLSCTHCVVVSDAHEADRGLVDGRDQGHVSKDSCITSMINRSTYTIKRMLVEYLQRCG